MRTLAIVTAVLFAVACGSDDSSKPAKKAPDEQAAPEPDPPKQVTKQVVLKKPPPEKVVMHDVAGTAHPEAAALKDLAKRALTAYKAQDVDGMVALIPAKERSSAGEAIKPGGPMHSRFFGENSWQWKAVSAWDGAIGEVRGSATDAIVQFSGNAERVYAVQFLKVDGSWYFRNLQDPRPDDFGVWGLKGSTAPTSVDMKPPAPN